MNCLSKTVSPYAFAIVAALLTAPMAQAALINVNATTTVQGSPVAPPTTTGNGISTVDLTGKVGANNVVVNAGANQVTVSVLGGGGIVTGSQAGIYAAPVVNSSGTTVSAPYLSTNTTSNGPGGSYSLTFASLQSYLGLLWGSIGTGDLLTFSKAGATVASVTGTQAMNAAVGFNGANGAQGFGGSQYTLVNFLNGTTFDAVVFSQTVSASFESANLQYAARNVNAVPEPEVIVLVGIGLAAAVASRRRRIASH